MFRFKLALLIAVFASASVWAGERTLPLHPVELPRTEPTQLPPAENGEAEAPQRPFAAPLPEQPWRIRSVTTAGSWIAWVEMQPIDPRTRRVFYRIKLWRMRADGSHAAELLLMPRDDRRTRFALAEDGTVMYALQQSERIEEVDGLIRTRRTHELHIVPVSGERSEIQLPLDAQVLRMDPGHVLLTEEIEGREKVMLYTIETDRLGEGRELQLDPDDWSSDRLIMACDIWRAFSHSATLLDKATGEARETGGERFILHGIWNGWAYGSVSLHKQAKFVHLATGEELTLPTPGLIYYVCPAGIVYEAEGAGLRLWDPIDGRRIAFAGSDLAQLTYLPAQDSLSEGLLLLNRDTESSSQLATQVFYLEIGAEMQLVPAEQWQRQLPLIDLLEAALVSDQQGATSEAFWRCVGPKGPNWPYPPGLLELIGQGMHTLPRAADRARVADWLARSTDPQAREMLLEALAGEHAVDKYTSCYGIVPALAHVAVKDDVPAILASHPCDDSLRTLANTLVVLGHPAGLTFLEQAQENLDESLETEIDAAQQAIDRLRQRPRLEALLLEARQP